MSIEWPDGLRGCITTAKSRSQTVGFRDAAVSSGPAYVELVTNDAPTTWSVQFKFNRGEARGFSAWLSLNSIRFESPWISNFPIKIEEGLAEHKVRFLSDGYPQLTSENGKVFTYSATIIAREIKSEDNLYPEAVLGLSEMNCYKYDWASNILDIAINVSAPEDVNGYQKDLETIDIAINISAPQDF